MRIGGSTNKFHENTTISFYSNFLVVQQHFSFAVLILMAAVQPPKKYRCHGKCKQLFYIKDMKFVQSIMMISPSKLKNKYGTNALTDAGMEAYSWHCPPCALARIETHVAYQKAGGMLCTPHSPMHKKVMKDYPRLKDKMQLGLGRDRHGRASFFNQTRASKERFEHGTVIRVDLMSLVPDVASADIHADEDTTVSASKSKDKDDVKMYQFDSGTDEEEPDCDDDGNPYQKGGVFGHDETNHFLEWCEGNKVGGCLNKAAYFKKHGLPMWMYTKGNSHRKPSSYAGQFSVYIISRSAL